MEKAKSGLLNISVQKVPHTEQIRALEILVRTKEKIGVSQFGTREATDLVIIVTTNPVLVKTAFPVGEEKYIIEQAFQQRASKVRCFSEIEEDDNEAFLASIEENKKKQGNSENFYQEEDWDLE